MMTTADPTPGNTEQKSSHSGFGKVLLPVVSIVLMVVGGLWLMRVWITPTAVTVTAIQEGTGTSPATGPAEMRLGAILPEFQLREYLGNSDISVSSLKAKVLLVNFWATWCEPCMVEMPSIIHLHQAYKDRGFEVVAVNIDSNPASVLPRALKKYEMSFPVYLDVDNRLADLFDVQAIPLSVVIDGNRKILMIVNEGINWNGPEFRSKLEVWLAG